MMRAVREGHSRGREGEGKSTSAGACREARLVGEGGRKCPVGGSPESR